MATDTRLKIFNEIEAERAYQDAKWGNTFDDKNTVNDWNQYIAGYGYRAASMENVGKPEEQRAAMVKVAALAVAALETFDRNNGFAPRHYDPARTT